MLALPLFLSLPLPLLHHFVGHVECRGRAPQKSKKVVNNVQKCEKIKRVWRRDLGVMIEDSESSSPGSIPGDAFDSFFFFAKALLPRGTSAASSPLSLTSLHFTSWRS